MQPQNPEQPNNEQFPTPSLEPSIKKPRNWKIFFIFLAIANIVTIGLPPLIINWLTWQANAGVSGTEFIAIILLMPLQISGLAVAVLNVIIVPLFLYKRRPKILAMVFGIVVVIASLAYLGTIALSAVKSIQQNAKLDTPLSRQEAISLIDSCKVVGISKTDRVRVSLKPGTDPDNPHDYPRYANDSDFDALKSATEKASEKCGKINVQDEPDTLTPQGLTVEKATEMLNSCRLVGFYYTEQLSGGSDELKAEDSTTGIVLAYIERPLHIHVADRMVETMVPIARAAQQKCPDLQFWHDGTYEQRDADGNWR